MGTHNRKVNSMTLGPGELYTIHSDGTRELLGNVKEGATITRKPNCLERLRTLVRRLGL